MRVDPDTFESLYRSANDPWNFATSAYELGRYETIIAGLESPRYSRCFEPACSLGVLTERLAACADTVVACDASPTAIAAARSRLATVDNVELVRGAVPDFWPAGTFDLVVLSELGYYWDLRGWRDIIRRSRACLRPGGELVAVHWLGVSADHVLDGTSVHRELHAQLGEPDLHVEQRSDPRGGFVLDRWSAVQHG